jgi:ABC-2 type transport system permease protein
MPNLYRLKELTLFDFSYSLANLKSLAFTIPYFFFWYIFFEKISDLAVEKIQSAQGLFVASWALDNQELAVQMFVDRPASISIYLLVSISIMPLFILLAANNQYSSDAARGAFRFILTRATRIELYLSRFIAVAILVLSCLFITSVWASIQAVINNEAELQNIITYGFQTYMLLSFYSLPFIAFMSTVSVLTRTAFGCLFLGMMMYILILTISIFLQDDISYSVYLIPSGIKSILIDVTLENIFISVAALSCYTLIYFGCGWFIFNRRDM